MWNKVSLILSMLGVVVFGSSCTSNKVTGTNTPQKVLSDYVARSFSVQGVPEKPKLLELATGEVKETLEKMSDAEFRAYFVDSKREFTGLKVRDERKISEDRYSITYELSFNSKTAESFDKITNKKSALFVQKDSKWLISEVKNIKTLIEHQNEFSF